MLSSLISDTQTNGEQRVPFLGRIPLIGEAFRTRSAKKTKTNLMVFIQPKILRDGIATAFETNEKYNYIRDQQRRSGPRGEILPMLPGTKKMVLPDLPPPPVPPAGDAGKSDKPGAKGSTTGAAAPTSAPASGSDAAPATGPAPAAAPNATPAAAPGTGR